MGSLTSPSPSPSATSPKSMDLSAKTSPYPSRWYIIASFWLVIILSLPVWWNTTKIERQPLPKSQVEHWNSLSPCPIRFPIRLTSNSPEISSASMKSQVQSLGARLETGNVKYDETIDILTARCFDFHVQSALDSGSGDSVILHRYSLDDQNQPHVFPNNISISLTTSNKPKELLRIIAPRPSSSSSTHATDSRVINYSSDLTLVFSLMNEDCAQPGSIRTWSIKRAIELYLEELLTTLAPLHNFTCQTQILHHSPLAFEPVLLQESKPIHIVEQDDLKAFINDADWNLATSVTMEPVLHFVLWVPSTNRRPFKIRRTDGTLDHDGSFIRPQWGSVVIYNPEQTSLSSNELTQLDEVELAWPMQIFRHHLLSLLGVVDTLETHVQRTLAIDATVRRRIIENSLETINSLQVILKLISDQTNMRVSAEAQNQVKGSLLNLKSAQEELLKADGSLWTAGLYADRSKRLSSTAFFSPTMLSLLYFPDEHKYAIYTPLFGPVLVPLVITLIRELKSRRNNSSTKMKTE